MDVDSQEELSNETGEPAIMETRIKKLFQKKVVPPARVLQNQPSFQHHVLASIPSMTPVVSKKKTVSFISDFQTF